MRPLRPYTRQKNCFYTEHAVVTRGRLLSLRLEIRKSRGQRRNWKFWPNSNLKVNRWENGMMKLRGLRKEESGLVDYRFKKLYGWKNKRKWVGRRLRKKWHLRNDESETPIFDAHDNFWLIISIIICVYVIESIFQRIGAPLINALGQSTDRTRKLKLWETSYWEVKNYSISVLLCVDI